MFASWQDWVMTAGAFIFTALLVPTLKDSSAEVPRTTSVPTAITLIAFSYTYLTLDLYLSAISNFFTAILRILIAVYRPIRD